MCGQYCLPSKKLVELYHNAAAVESTSDTQIQQVFDPTSFTQPASKKNVLSKAQCWYRTMPTERKIET